MTAAARETVEVGPRTGRITIIDTDTVKVMPGAMAQRQDIGIVKH